MLLVCMYKGPFIELLRDCSEGRPRGVLTFSAWGSMVVGDLGTSPRSTVLALALESPIFGSKGEFRA